jgi:hypothetical protein
MRLARLVMRLPTLTLVLAVAAAAASRLSPLAAVALARSVAGSCKRKTAVWTTRN